MGHIGYDVGVPSFEVTPSLSPIDPGFEIARIASMRVILIIIWVTDVEIGSTRTKAIIQVVVSIVTDVDPHVLQIRLLVSHRQIEPRRMFFKVIYY